MHQTIRAFASGRRWFVSCVLALVGLPAVANDMKSGLWELTTDIAGTGATDQFNDQIRQQIATMPPEQRKKMEELMVRPAPSSSVPSGNITKRQLCISKDAADNKNPPMQLPTSCTRTVVSQTANNAKANVVCTQPPMSGETEIVVTSDRAFNLKAAFATTTQGLPRTFAINMTGLWLSEDCGSVKPGAP